RDRLAQRIRQTPGHDPTLLEEPAEVLSSRLAEVEESLEELVSVHERVIELRSEIARVKEGHEVEEALAERDRCVEALRTVRARDVEARVAAILVEYVERANRDRHLPDVFHRASALFAR